MSGIITVTSVFLLAVIFVFYKSNNTDQESISEAKSEELLAFPSAVGYGKHTIGGRRGQVIYVTSLADSGPGTFRAALEASGPRVVLFKIGGTITLTDNVLIRDPFITVAGQSSPGGGILIRGAGIQIQASEVILRHLRIRPGDNDYRDVNGKINESNDTKDWDGITILPNQESLSNIIIDHCSISWGIDEGIGINDGGKSIYNLTVSNCIISEGLNDSHHEKGPHSKGVLINMATNFDTNQHAYNITFYANLFVHNLQRNVMLSEGNEMEFINNLVYNFGRGTILKPDSKASIVGNFYKAGPDTRDQADVIPGLGGVKNRGIQIILPNESGTASFYLYDNVGIGRDTESFPGVAEWDEVWYFSEQAPSDSGTLAFMSESAPRELSGIKPWPAKQVPNKILPSCGATLPVRDEVDNRIVNEVKAGTGNIRDSQNQVGGYPNMDSGEQILDTDLDGMPDKWENSEGFDPNEPDGTLDSNGNGYTNLEEFLNSLEKRLP